MPVEIQDIEVIAQPSAQSGQAATTGGHHERPSGQHPELQLELERAAQVRRSRDVRLRAD
jgi:hypothetical protein